MDVGGTTVGLEQLSTSVCTAITFIQGLCQRHARLQFIGLDLLLPVTATEVTIHEYTTQLRSQVRHQTGAFAYCLGMIWAKRQEMDGSAYLHALFVFDGAKVQGGMKRGNWIGDYWQGVVTDGVGGYRNLNHLQQLGGGQGLGMIYTVVAKQVGDLYYRLIYLMGSTTSAVSMQFIGMV